MTHTRNDRQGVLRSSRSYYARRAYYQDLIAQRRRSDTATERELDFLEHAFRTHAQRRIGRVLDVQIGILEGLGFSDIGPKAEERVLLKPLRYENGSQRPPPEEFFRSTSPPSGRTEWFANS